MLQFVASVPMLFQLVTMRGKDSARQGCNNSVCRAAEV
jgi:hypothetical protein